MKHLTALTIMLAIFLHPLVAYGNCPADLNPINKGDSAPCTGVLFTQAAAAKIIADLEFAKNKCDVRVMKKERELTAVCDSSIEKEKIKCAAAAKVAKNQLDLCVSDLDYTTKQLAKKSTNNLKWFSVGAASGIAFTLVTAWAIGKVVN